MMQSVMGAIRCTSLIERRLHSLWKQYPHLAALLHAPCLGAGLFAETPEKIGAHCSLDCTAGILRQHQAVQGFAGIRIGG